MELLCGTSGFAYKAWRGTFYPDDLSDKKFLSYYADRLPAVEINNTFYRMPRREMLEKWLTQVPASFRFVLKASQRITHQERLVDSAESVRYLVDTSSVLGSQRGPFLLQLPPYLRFDLERLTAFVEAWPEGVKAAFEFRHSSWEVDAVAEVLGRHRLAWCVADHGEEEQVPRFATTEYGYLRLRGADYDDESLREWATWVSRQDWREAYVFFKHEDEGVGPRLAARFQQHFEQVQGVGKAP